MTTDLYAELTKEPDWLANMKKDEKLVSCKYAYHVVDAPAEQPQPEFEELRWHLANDETYDRQLVGLGCVFFTTTMWGFDLPDTSPYPAHCKNKTRQWRVRIPLDFFKDYTLWYCENPSREFSNCQIRLILADDNESRDYLEGHPSIRCLGNMKAPNPFLYFDVECKKWMTNQFRWYKTNYIVNFVVLKDFPLKDDRNEEWRDGISWDTVTRSDVGEGYPMSRDDLARVVAKEWSSDWKLVNMPPAPAQNAVPQPNPPVAEPEVDEVAERIRKQM